MHTRTLKPIATALSIAVGLLANAQDAQAANGSIKNIMPSTIDVQSDGSNYTGIKSLKHTHMNVGFWFNTANHAKWKLTRIKPQFVVQGFDLSAANNLIKWNTKNYPVGKRKSKVWHENKATLSPAQTTALGMTVCQNVKTSLQAQGLGTAEIFSKTRKVSVGAWVKHEGQLNIGKNHSSGLGTATPKAVASLNVRCLASAPNQLPNLQDKAEPKPKTNVPFVGGAKTGNTAEPALIRSARLSVARGPHMGRCPMTIPAQFQANLSAPGKMTVWVMARNKAFPASGYPVAQVNVSTGQRSLKKTIKISTSQLPRVLFGPNAATAQKLDLQLVYRTTLPNGTPDKTMRKAGRPVSITVDCQGAGQAGAASRFKSDPAAKPKLQRRATN